MQRPNQMQHVTPQQQHMSNQAHAQKRQPLPPNLQQQMQGKPQNNHALLANIPHEQLMILNRMQQLMGNNQQAHGNQRQDANGANNKHKQERKRLPSLHIGNLPTKFYDLDLYKFIKTQGHAVVKAFVVLDKKTNKSLNYGYAQFATEAEAVACQKALNNTEIDGKVTIWSLQADTKPNPKANILVRNLATSLTQKQVYQYYEKFGPIQKCKLECYADGLSRGYAYVQFEKEADAAEAVKQTNGQEWEQKTLEVFAHQRRKDEQTPEKLPAQGSNNIFVQGLVKGTSDEKVKQMFGKFGEITSCVVQKSDSDEMLGNNAFVCFKDAANASRAVDEMNKTKLANGNFLLVSFHVAKRQNDLAQDKTKAIITQNMNKNFQSNLFVNHIPANTSEADIHNLFKEFGEIISIKIKQKSAATSRFSHAYVLLDKVEACQAAIKKLDKSRPFGNTPIDVEFWVSKVDLAAERESKAKEQMQKDFNSAIYEIRNEFFGGRKQTGGRQRQGNNNRGRQGGRGGRPQQSSERKGSKEPRGKSQPKAAQYVQIPLPAPERVEKLKLITDEEERTQQIGNMIWESVSAAFGQEKAGKITGMLLDKNVVNHDKLLTDQAYFSEFAGQAKDILDKQIASEQPKQAGKQ